MNARAARPRRRAWFAAAALTLAAMTASTACSNESSSPPATEPPPATVLPVTANDPAAAQFCARFFEVQQQFGSTFRDHPEQYRQGMTELTQAAPPAVKPDMDAFNAFVQKASAEELEKPPPDVSAALGRIISWTGTNCRVATP